MTHKTTPYQAVIRNNTMAVWRSYFPLHEILAPPYGWAFKRITQWRIGKPDECWRIVFERSEPQS